MDRRLIMIWLVLFCSCVIAFGAQAAKSTDDQSEFRWLETSSDTAGVKYQTRRLQTLSPKTYSGPPIQVEREETRIDSNTTRIVSRTFNTSANGQRILTETAVEEITKRGDGEVSAVRTTSQRDLNGRMHVVSKETQEVLSAGPDTYRISKTVLLPGINNALEEKERTQQVEKRKGESLVEIDRTRYEVGADGKWTAIDRRLSQNRMGKEQVQTDEQVYQRDVSGQLSLSQQVKTSEWRDEAGQMRLQSETFGRKLDGKFQLDSRVTLIQKNLGNRGSETTERIEARNPASPGEGLRLVQSAVEKSQPLGSDQTQKSLEILKPDLNGRMGVIHQQKMVEKK